MVQVCLEIGFRTADNIVFLADCLSSRETRNKYQISFIYNVAVYIETLKQVKLMTVDLFVSSHAEATKEIAVLVQYNIDKVIEIAERITKLCREPLCFEAVLQELFVSYGLQMNFEQYVLVGSTIAPIFSVFWIRGDGKPADSTNSIYQIGGAV